MGAAKVTLYKPASVPLGLFGMRRPAPQAIAGDPARLASFDDTTMFFDVFRSASGEILCLGPPLPDSGMEPDGLRVTGADHTRLALRIEEPRTGQQHTSRVIIAEHGEGDPGEVVLHAGGRSETLAVRASPAALLAGRRVLMTLSRDNPLPWIRDWAAFHVSQHAADAVLVYDNGSRDYTKAALGEALAGIPGLAAAVVVDWPFRYGSGGAPGQSPLDNFCQTGALDHARRCFCPLALSVLNLDVDELLPAEFGSVFAQIETSPFAALLFRGIWAEAPGVGTPEARRRVRHADCIFAWRAQLETLLSGGTDGLCRTKWAAVPARCTPDLEWGIHDVYPATPRAHATQRAWRAVDHRRAYRHCRQINTGWKTDRWRSSSGFADLCCPDAVMQQAFAPG